MFPRLVAEVCPVGVFRQCLRVDLLHTEVFQEDGDDGHDDHVQHVVQQQGNGHDDEHQTALRLGSVDLILHGLEERRQVDIDDRDNHRDGSWFTNTESYLFDEFGKLCDCPGSSHQATIFRQRLVASVATRGSDSCSDDDSIASGNRNHLADVAISSQTRSIISLTS